MVQTSLEIPQDLYDELCDDVGPRETKPGWIVDAIQLRLELVNDRELIDDE